MLNNIINKKKTFYVRICALFNVDKLFVIYINRLLTCALKYTC